MGRIHPHEEYTPHTPTPTPTTHKIQQMWFKGEQFGIQAVPAVWQCSGLTWYGMVVLPVPSSNSMLWSLKRPDTGAATYLDYNS